MTNPGIRVVAAENAAKPAERVLLLWDVYSPTLEARLISDLLRLIGTLPLGSTLSVMKGSAKGNASAIQRLVERLGFEFSYWSPGQPLTAIMRYYKDVPPDLPDYDYGTAVFDRPMGGPRFETTMHTPEPPPPPQVYVPINDPYPKFRSRVPQGTPSTGNLPWWAWTNNVVIE
jgi:hypothetical protein